MGHIIYKEGITTDPEKVEAIMGWPIPKSVYEIISFMGLVRYYKRFIEGFSKVAHTFTSLHNKGIKFTWTIQCEESF